MYVQQRDSADYIRVVSEPDSGSKLYNVFEFYPNGKSKLAAKSSTIDPPKYEGDCITYYPNGKKLRIAKYRSGKVIGNSYEYYPNGKLYRIIKWLDVAEPNPYDSNTSMIAEHDSLGTALVTDSNGYYKGYDNKFKYIVEEGNIKNGKRDGQWKGVDEDVHIRFAENYDNGKLLLGMSVGESNDTVSYKLRQVQPQYKGGINAFSGFLANNIQYPDYERAHNVQGTVILTFIVEKNGKVSNIKVLEHVSNNIDKEAIRVLKSSPDWISGTAYGRPARVLFTQPINFSLRD